MDLELEEAQQLREEEANKLKPEDVNVSCVVSVCVMVCVGGGAWGSVNYCKYLYNNKLVVMFTVLIFCVQL